MDTAFSAETRGSQDSISTEGSGLHEPANPLARVLARVLDSVLVCAAYLLALRLIALALSSLQGDEPRGEAASMILWSILIVLLPGIGFAYEFGLVSKFGRTIGKAVIGLEIVDSNSKRPLGKRRAACRAIRLVLLYVALPVGVWSARRLLFVKGSRRWYDKNIEADVVWGVTTASRRRRPWIWAEAHYRRNHTRYLLGIVWLLGVLFFLLHTRPWEMNEAQATDAIRTLVSLNGVTFVAFVGSATLAKDIRSGLLSNETRDSLSFIVVMLGVASLGGIISGIAYLSTATYPHIVATERFDHRLLSLVLLVTGLYAMAGLWVVKIETDRALERKHAGDSRSAASTQDSQEVSDTATQAPHPQPSPEHQQQPKLISARFCATAMSALMGWFAFVALCRALSRRRRTARPRGPLPDSQRP